MERTAHLETGGSFAGRRTAGIAFDWAITAAAAWMTLGSYLDGWAHNHIPTLETFFTPWHAVLYSGFGALVAVLAVELLRYRAQGASWAQTIPRGYGPSYVGAAVFMLGGLGDMTWHQLFGVEADLEALVSPTHLLLAAGGVLLFAGPLRAAWGRRESSARELWPAVLSLTYLLCLFSFFTVPFHPLSRPWAFAGNIPASGGVYLASSFPNINADPSGIGGLREMAAIIGLAGFLIQGAILAGVVLTGVRRWGSRLPAGTFTVMFTINALLVGFERDTLVMVPVALLAGTTADLMLKALAPSSMRLASVRLFAFGVPALYYLYLYAALDLLGGTWWTLPLWTGSIVYAGAAGLALSFLVIPPGGGEAAGSETEDAEDRAA